MACLSFSHLVAKNSCRSIETKNIFLTLLTNKKLLSINYSLPPDTTTFYVHKCVFLKKSSSSSPAAPTMIINLNVKEDILLVYKT
jgi:hypothetical protein